MPLPDFIIGRYEVLALRFRKDEEMDFASMAKYAPYL